jgi:hypothetical protein
MNLFTPFETFLIYAFLVVGVAAALVSLAVIVDFVTSNRRVRLARQESIGHYYRGFALTH